MKKNKKKNRSQLNQSVSNKTDEKQQTQTISINYDKTH